MSITLLVGTQHEVARPTRAARSARKHHIGNAQIVAAMIDAGVPTVEGDALVFIGKDNRGAELHVVAVPDDRGEGLAVIHAMPKEWGRDDRPEERRRHVGDGGQQHRPGQRGLPPRP